MRAGTVRLGTPIANTYIASVSGCGRRARLQNRRAEVPSKMVPEPSEHGQGLHGDMPALRAGKQSSPPPALEGQPDDSTVDCWYMDDRDDDQRNPHRQDPNVPASPADLRKLGVLIWSLDTDKYEHDGRLEAIRKVRGYTYDDVLTLSREAFPALDEMLKATYREHMHDGEEVVFMLDGSGYFDVRDADDQWIRMHCKKGDMVMLPGGIYHRFTLDNNNYAKGMRLAVGDPTGAFTPINRDEGTELHAARNSYLSLLASLEGSVAA